MTCILFGQWFTKLGRRVLFKRDHRYGVLPKNDFLNLCSLTGMNFIWTIAYEIDRNMFPSNWCDKRVVVYHLLCCCFWDIFIVVLQVWLYILCVMEKNSISQAFHWECRKCMFFIASAPDRTWCTKEHIIIILYYNILQLFKVYYVGMYTHTTITK